MLEVEVKLPLPAQARAALVQRLHSLGASPGPLQHQVDIFFRHPQRDLAATDEALRLRRVGARLELTYKGPRLGGPTKARIEHNVQVASDPTALLAALGFVPAATLTKDRQPFHLSGVEVAVDDVAGVGAFVEIEATGADREAATRLVEDAVRKLGLQALPRESRSYLELASRPA